MRKFKTISLIRLDDMNTAEFRYELNLFPIIVSITPSLNNIAWIVVLESNSD